MPSPSATPGSRAADRAKHRSRRTDRPRRRRPPGAGPAGVSRYGSPTEPARRTQRASFAGHPLERRHRRAMLGDDRRGAAIAHRQSRSPASGTGPAMTSVAGRAAPNQACSPPMRPRATSTTASPSSVPAQISVIDRHYAKRSPPVNPPYEIATTLEPKGRGRGDARRPRAGRYAAPKAAAASIAATPAKVAGSSGVTP